MSNRLKISKSDVLRIIEEELSSMHEQVDHESIREVVNAASKLLAAVETFKETASPSMLNAMTPDLDKIANVLEDMVSSPGSYVQKKPTGPRKVSLRPVKDENIV